MLDNVIALLVFLAKGYDQHIDARDQTIVATEVLLEWSAPHADTLEPLLDNAGLARLSKLIDIIMTDSEGGCKGPDDALNFLRQCAKTRDEYLAKSGTAPEHAASHEELDETSVSQCYNDFGINFIKQKRNLLPHQVKDKNTPSRSTKTAKKSLRVDSVSS